MKRIPRSEIPTHYNFSQCRKNLDRSNGKIKLLTSVIIPTYNREMFVTEALESVALQTEAPYEVIVVDDGSTDRTKTLVAKHFPSVVYIRTQNQGVSSARNIGFQMSKGNIIAFLDSDDLWLPNKLEEQLAYLEENPEIRHFTL